MRISRLTEVLLLAALFLCPLVRAQDADATEAKAPKLKVAVFSIQGALTEGPQEFSLTSLMSDMPTLSMMDYIHILREARSDDSLAGVVFDLDKASLGFAQVQELRQQFQLLRKAGKDVWIYSDHVSAGGLMLGAEATELVLMPEGNISFHGIYSESMYFKNLLDKLGVQADIVHIGDFKSAGESFYLTGPSEASQQQTQALLDSLFGQITDMVARSNEISAEKVRALMDRPEIRPKDAVKAGLVDRLAYRHDFSDQVRERYGKDTEVVFDYLDPDKADVEIKGIMDLFSLFSPKKKTTVKEDPAVGVIVLEGSIDNESVQEARKALVKAADDDSIKAMVFRVDSPGGSAAASDLLCDATRRFKESGKPFIVSMGNVAASGGYYISALADKIYAQPGTITGSIGVVGGKLVMKDLLDKVGITTHAYQMGKYAHLLSSTHSFTEEERALVRQSMLEVYGVFKDRIRTGRGDRIQGDLDGMAGGRVYTGSQALPLGLIDEEGGLYDAIEYAAAKAKLGEAYRFRLLPRKKEFSELLSELLGDSPEQPDFIRSAGFRSLVNAALPLLNRLDPAKATSLENALKQLELFNQEGVLLIAPDLRPML